MKTVVFHRGLFLFCMVLALSLIGAPGALCKTSSKPEVLFEKAENCRKALYRSAKKRRYRHNWERCLRRYQSLYKRYPRSNRGAWALYRSGQMLTKLYGYSGQEKDLDKAIEHYRNLAEDHEDHLLADDAQYLIGQIYYEHKKDPSQAYVEFLKVDIKFPSGDMRPRARSMLDRLEGIISKKESEQRKRDASSSATALTPVQDIRHLSTPTYTRVVIDLQRRVEYDYHLLKKDPDLKKPRRLYVDLKKTYVSSDIESSIPIRDGLLQRARAGQFSKDTVRVVLDINSIKGYKVFHLHDPFRIVVDVHGEEMRAPAQKGAKANERPVRRGVRKVGKPDHKVSLARQLGLSVQRIVIDPGHGGRDPGCYFKGGVKEKQIVLKLARKLANKIEQRLGCEAILTRNKDAFVRLENRTALANMKKADLFISLHINAHKQKGVHGLETYFLNMATDERAVMVAARENATSEKNISDLQRILNDLMLNTKIHESSKLAYEVQRGMISQVKGKYDRVRDLGVKQAPFYVLIGAEMPAILVETGFITNPRERGRLLNDKYLDTLADGILVGIDSYIKSIDQVYMGG